MTNVGPRREDESILTTEEEATTAAYEITIDEEKVEAGQLPMKGYPALLRVVDEYVRDRLAYKRDGEHEPRELVVRIRVR